MTKLTPKQNLWKGLPGRKKTGCGLRKQQHHVDVGFSAQQAAGERDVVLEKEEKCRKYNYVTRVGRSVLNRPSMFTWPQVNLAGRESRHPIALEFGDSRLRGAEHHTDGVRVGVPSSLLTFPQNPE